MKLTVRRDNGWCVIECAEHDGRVWLEPMGGNGFSLQTSARFSDADVEGTSAEMLAIAEAIEKRGSVGFKRCAVRMAGETAEFWSPRNSHTSGFATLAEADELATLIRATVKL